MGARSKLLSAGTAGVLTLSLFALSACSPQPGLSGSPTPTESATPSSSGTAQSAEPAKATPSAEPTRVATGLTWDDGSPVEAGGFSTGDAVPFAEGDAPEKVAELPAKKGEFLRIAAATNQAWIGVTGANGEGIVGVGDGGTPEEGDRLVSIDPGTGEVSKLYTAANIEPQDGPRNVVGVDADDSGVVWAENGWGNTASSPLRWKLFQSSSTDPDDVQVNLLGTAEDHAKAKKAWLPPREVDAVPVLVGDEVWWNTLDVAEEGAEPVTTLLAQNTDGGGKTSKVTTGITDPVAFRDGVAAGATTWELQDDIYQPLTKSVVQVGEDGSKQLLLKASKGEVSLLAAAGDWLLVEHQGELIAANPKEHTAWKVSAAEDEGTQGSGAAVCGSVATFSFEGDEPLVDSPQYFLNLESGEFTTMEAETGSTMTGSEAHCTPNGTSLAISQAGPGRTFREVLYRTTF